MSEYLSRDQILNAQDFKTEEVEVPEWGGTVLIKELSAAQVEKVGFSMATSSGKIDARKAKGMMMEVVHLGVVDETHRPIFNRQDVKLLGQKSYKAIKKVATTIMLLSGLAEDEERPFTIECPSCSNEFEVDLAELDDQYKELNQTDQDEEDVDPKNE